MDFVRILNEFNMFNKREILGLRPEDYKDHNFWKGVKMRMTIDLLLGIILGGLVAFILLFSSVAKAGLIEDMAKNDREVVKRMTIEKDKMNYQNQQRLIESKKLQELKNAKQIKPDLARYRILKDLKKINKKLLIARGVRITNSAMLAITLYCTFFQCGPAPKDEKEENEK